MIKIVSDNNNIFYLSGLKEGDDISFIFFDKNKRQEKTILRIDRDVAYRIYKAIYAQIKNLSFLTVNIELEPFFIEIKKNQITVGDLTSNYVNDVVIKFDDISFEYFGKLLKKYALMEL